MDISYLSGVTSTSDIGDYLVRPYFNPEIGSVTDETSVYYEADIALNERFNIQPAV